MILDAGCGNRHMWRAKDVPQVIYLDKELRLKIPPTIFADNEALPFRTGSLEVVYFDPPHGKWMGMPVFGDPQEHRIPGCSSTFYGYYKSIPDHFRYIAAACEEFFRVIKADGVLNLKWNESDIPLRDILAMIGHRWIPLLINPIRSVSQRGEDTTYWVTLAKRILSSPSQMDPYLKVQVIRDTVRPPRSKEPMTALNQSLGSFLRSKTQSCKTKAQPIRMRTSPSSKWWSRRPKT